MIIIVWDGKILVVDVCSWSGVLCCWVCKVFKVMVLDGC